MADSVALVLKALPEGKAMPAPPSRPGFASSLDDRPGLVLVAASALDADDDRLGLAAYRRTVGALVLEHGVIVPDDLGEPARRAVEEAASVWIVETTGGPEPAQVRSLSEFAEPHGGIFARSYSTPAFLIGADLLRCLSLLSEHVIGRRSGGEVSCWLPGWGRWRPEKVDVVRVSPNRPCVRVRPRRVGGQASWEPLGKGAGKMPRDLARGGFVDVLAAAYALDAARTNDFGEHARTFGLEAGPLPVAVRPDAAGVAAVLEAVGRVHELAVVLDEASGAVFTTADERAEGRRRVHLPSLASPGTLAASIPARFGLRAPRETLDLEPADELAAVRANLGGLTITRPELLVAPLPVVAADRVSGFPDDFVAVEGWRLLTADAVRRVELEPAELLEACTRVAERPELAAGPELRRRWGLAVVKMRPRGRLPLPTRIATPRRPEGDLGRLLVDSGGEVLAYHALDVLASSVLTGEVPDPAELLGGFRIVPVGRQAGLRERLPLLPGLVLDLNEDPVGAIARHRQAVKDDDPRLGAVLRVLANALAFGVLGQSTPSTRRQGKRRIVVERPGPWYCPILAGAVTASSRLALAHVERRVTDAGGLVAFAAVDSAFVPASAEGGEHRLADGTVVPLLPAAEVEAILGGVPSNLGGGLPAWRVTRAPEGRQAWATIFGAGRHVEHTLDEAGQLGEVLGWTEGGLGGSYSPPPGTGAGWSREAARREVAFAIARQRTPATAQRTPVSWADNFPAVQARQVTTARELASLPASLGARIGSRYLVAVAEPGSRDPRRPVALDRGGDLSDWRGLRWIDRATGRPVEVGSTWEEAEAGAFRADVLAMRAGDFGRRLPPGPGPEVVVERLETRGADSPLLDALERGDEDPDAVQARGRLCERVGCWVPVTRATARFCSPACREAGRRARSRAQRSGATAAACLMPGCDAAARPRSTVCSERHRVALRRLRTRGARP